VPGLVPFEGDERITPKLLGFQPVPGRDDSAWTKPVADYICSYRLLQTLDELLPTEPLQRDVLGVTDHDLNPAMALLTTIDTGGHVIGAFKHGEEGEELIAALVGYGGFVRRRPIIVSDLLVVRADMRSAGLGAEMKRVQAAISLAAGFEAIEWTVDPLRAANARLNVEKLGATSHHYDIDRYGSEFGAGLYGGMPTDRLQMWWEIGSDAVRDRLLGKIPPLTAADIAGVPVYDPDRPRDRVLVHLPSDIDALLKRDAGAALAWRYRLRASLQSAFAAGYEITGFVPGSLPEQECSSFVLTRRF
jgi:predicted GNAT superfamily acetyltransferase